MTSCNISFACMCLQKMAEASAESVTPSRKGRKRVRKLYTWKRIKRKTLRNSGKSYTTAKNKEVCSLDRVHYTDSITEAYGTLEPRFSVWIVKTIGNAGFQGVVAFVLGSIEAHDTIVARFQGTLGCCYCVRIIAIRARLSTQRNRCNLKQVPAKQMDTAPCKCRLKCFELVDEAHRQQLFDGFGRLLTSTYRMPIT